jgi:hypothetical protein
MESLSTGSDTSKVYSGGQAHVCHCIGCCEDCGMCRTYPGHTPDVCKLKQEQDATLAKKIRQSTQGGW